MGERKRQTVMFALKVRRLGRSFVEGWVKSGTGTVSFPSWAPDYPSINSKSERLRRCVCDMIGGTGKVGAL